LIISIPAFSLSSLAAARDGISIVGLSTVFPFAAAVAEDAGRGAKFKRRKVECNATGGGRKLFSEGVGVNRPAITNAFRPIKASELQSCTANGVVTITEGNIGFHGILAEARVAASINPTLKDIFTALTKDVPDAHDKLIPDPNKIWTDVNRSLPDIKAVLGPSPTSATRDAFAERAMAAKAARDLFPMGHRTR
jgi:phosphate transport system substrate-binding protein